MRLTEAERAHAIQLLQGSQAEFLGFVSELTDAQWAWHPAADSWSVGEAAEHIVLSEAGMFKKIKKALNRAPDPDWEIKTGAKREFLVRLVPDGSQSFHAPESLRPHSQWTPRETIVRYQELRARVFEFIEQTDC